MQDVSHCSGICIPLLHNLNQIFSLAHPAAGDDRNGDLSGDGIDERYVETAARSLAVDGGQQDLPGTEFDPTLYPIDHVQSGPFAAVIGIGLPAIGPYLFRLDREHGALTAKTLSDLTDQLRSRNRCSVDGHFVSPAAQQLCDIVR